MKFLILLLACGTVFGQVTFEAATVDPIEMTLAQALGGRSSVTIDDSYATFRGQSPIQLIQRAYGVLADQIINLPDTSRGVNFDIRAKIPAGVSKDKVPEMLQALLAERFKLAVHRQDEQRKLYELTVAPGGTKKMQKVNAGGPGRCPLQDGHRICHAESMAELATMMTNLRTLALAAAKAPAAAAAGLAEMAANAPVDFLVDRPVIDKTGLEGRFEFAFDYGPIPGSPDLPPYRIVDSLNALNLKLVPVTSAVQTVVIDHIERMPTAN
ncbi:MAG TPA: TIGR03435 family protein [Bryobacteraceae bacterium]|nr:TIGR03435 family protein [Bryobacteraceae bacterium]